MSKTKTLVKTLLKTLSRFKNSFLNFQRKKTVRVVFQGTCVGLVSAGLFLQIPFYPYVIVLLLSLGFGSLALRYPRSALILCILLSIPAMARQHIDAWPIYSILCLFLIGTTKHHWLAGFLTLSSIIMWLTSFTGGIPSLTILSILPIILAGIIFSPTTGAIAGVTSAILATFFVTCHGWNPFPLPPIPLPHFRPSSIIDVFYGTNRQLILEYALTWIKIYVNTIAPWAETTLFGAIGYLAAKSIMWWRDCKLSLYIYPTILAALSSSVMFTVGNVLVGQVDLYTLKQSSLGDAAYLAITSLFAGFLVGLFKFEENLAKIRSSIDTVKPHLGELRPSLNRAKRKGMRISGYEEEWKRLSSELDGALKLCHKWRFTEATRKVEDAEKETEGVKRNLTADLERFHSFKETLKDVETKVGVLERSIEQAKGVYPNLDTSLYKNELTTIVSDLKNLKKTGKEVSLVELDKNSQSLSDRCDTLINELDEGVTIWENWPSWKTEVKKRLDKNGRVTTESLFGVDRKLRKYVLTRYWEESGEENLMFEGDALVRIGGQSICPNCGAPSSIGSVFCYLCGHRLIKETPRETKPIKPKPKPKVKQIPIEPSPSEIDDIVYDHIVQHGGTISLSEAAKDLKITKKKLRASIKRLKKAEKLE